MTPDRNTSRIARVLVVVGAVAVALVCVEASLRAAGFRFDTFPVVQFGYPDPVTLHDLFVVDRDLFWVTKDYAATLDEARRTHPAVIFMGDSCTQFGSYPGNVVQRLADIDPALGSGVKVGTVGWSSEQGRVQVTRDILPLGPRVITVYYGWNDHWVALGPPDSDARPNDVIWWLSQHTRLWQLATKFRRATPGSLEQRPLRVSIDRYAANLEAIADAAQKNGVKVVLITAPSGHQEGHEPAYLALRHLRKLSELVPLHRQYVAATRRAAEQSGATLCDAAAAFEADPAHATYFEQDGIHLNLDGNRAMARLVAPCILRATGHPAGATP